MENSSYYVGRKLTRMGEIVKRRDTFVVVVSDDDVSVPFNCSREFPVWHPAKVSGNACVYQRSLASRVANISAIGGMFRALRNRRSYAITIYSYLYIGPQVYKRRAYRFVRAARRVTAVCNLNVTRITRRVSRNAGTWSVPNSRRRITFTQYYGRNCPGNCSRRRGPNAFVRAFRPASRSPLNHSRRFTGSEILRRAVAAAFVSARPVFIYTRDGDGTLWRAYGYGRRIEEAFASNMTHIILSLISMAETVYRLLSGAI